MAQCASIWQPRYVQQVVVVKIDYDARFVLMHLQQLRANASERVGDGVQKSSLKLSERKINKKHSKTSVKRFRTNFGSG